MNAAQLIGHFERLSDSPGSVEQLRAFVLNLAVRGKLALQSPQDEPASELLTRIRSEKARLLEVGEHRKKKFAEEVPIATELFEVPSSWLWVPATYPAYVISDLGKKVQTKDVLDEGAFPVVDQGKVFIRGYCNDAEKVIQVKSPIILFGDHTRETKLIDFDFVVGADGVKLLKPILIVPQYYYLALLWLPLDSRGYGRHFKLLRESSIPLPPLAEQHRIIAKVDELMALCDRLDAARAEREAARDRLTAASLARLNTPHPETFREDASFVLDALPALIARPEQVKQLRQTILNLAVSGRLADQVQGDEPASQLLRRVRGDKAPNAAPVQPATKADLLPASWVSVELSEIAYVGTGLTPSRARPDYFDPPVIPWVTSGETGAPFISATAQHVSPIALTETSLKLYPPGTLLVAMYGQGKTRGQVTELLIEATTNQACAAIMLKLPDAAHRRYIKLCFEKMYDEIRQLSAGGAQPNLNVGKIKNTVIPLPPLSEQSRIVAKVDELMALCDRLEGSMASSEEHRRRLLDAVLHETLNHDEFEEEAA
jgi:type I restriction enzyme S subunit